MGNGIVMATKMIWDTLAGCTFGCLMMFNSIFLDPELKMKVQQINAEFFPLSYRIQQLFRDWANQSLGRVSFEFIDYLAIPFVNELRTQNLQSNKTEAEIIEAYLASLKLLEEFAQVIFQIALEDTSPELLTKINEHPWLNAWAISLDASKWETDGLFSPKNEPRNLHSIKKQYLEAINR